MAAPIEMIAEAVVNGNNKDIPEYINKALEDGISVDSIIEDGLLTGLRIIGGKFKRNEVYVPDILIAARAMHVGMEIIKPFVVQNVAEKAVIIMGTVKGDLHDIGKNLVSMMLEGSGFKVIDLGIDVSSDKFIKSIKEHNPKVVGLSALLTTTMSEMKNTIEIIKEYSGEIKVIVGGAPLSPEFAESIGADAYAPDAASAVDVVLDLIV